MQEDPETAGELNYAITLELIAYLDSHGLCYDTINDILGAIEAAKLEFVRRVVNPYEDAAIKRNGDLYS